MRAARAQSVPSLGPNKWSASVLPLLLLLLALGQPSACQSQSQLQSQLQQAHNVSSQAQVPDQGRGAQASASSNEGDESLMFAVEISYMLIFLVGFCGNSLVILVILRFTRTETVTDIYILNLAFADLMFLLGLVFLTTTILIDHWIFGNFMCKVSRLARARHLESARWSRWFANPLANPSCNLFARTKHNNNALPPPSSTWPPPR